MTPAAFPAHEATRAVLAGLIDYAGLFPPAGLSMPEAVANFAGYQRREDHWALGRLVVPAARLAELEEALQGLSAADGLGTRWPLTVLLGPDPEGDLRLVSAFKERHAHGGPEIMSLEAKAASTAAIAALATAAPTKGALYLELPVGGDLASLAAALKAAGVYAKVRTGSVRAEEFPSPDALLAFLATCAGLRLPFKATAGLHHPVRGAAPLTYLPGADTAVMFGYLNVLAAAAAYWHARPAAEARRWLLAEDRPGPRLDRDGLRWGDLHLTTAELAATRRDFMHAIGSCSFTEPVDELKALVMVAA